MSRRVHHFRPFRQKTPTETASVILRHKQEATARNGIIVTRQMDPEKALRIAGQLHRTRGVR